MNRSRYIDRIHLSKSADGEHGRIAGMAAEGTERGIALGTILASMASEDMLEALIRHLGALNEWGGQLYISATRFKFDTEGNRVEHRENGEYLTTGYIVNYGHRSTVKGQVQEPDTPLQAAEIPPPAAVPDPEDNGVPDPEPIAA
jgi:hypothetical protein